VPIYSHNDRGFEDDELPDLGKRLFTVSHPRQTGIVLCLVSVALLVATLALFSMHGEIYKLYSIFTALFALLAGGLGIAMLVKSRATTHVYELGVVRETAHANTRLLFESVDRCQSSSCDFAGDTAVHGFAWFFWQLSRT